MAHVHAPDDDFDALILLPGALLEPSEALLHRLGELRRVIVAAYSDATHLRAMYPGAEVRTFRSTGHITALVKPDEFVSAVKDFLWLDAQRGRSTSVFRPEKR